ncbi:MAG: beta-lactamase family protein [Clostridium argentinense]|uniref:serine hydrolase domain-containing protein n=1 Tax=uncultured Clostridium sp. TaxID=59620 RepID=UPI001D866149|nr:serine hydrolase domain-containing protein [uncultured Clostridium sp.]MBS5823136.1 beta-lactamase family protein [Clostridium argentinense]MDU1350391.1 serine hydrolase domain-containing protein [Clostridium argentinense]
MNKQMLDKISINIDNYLKDIVEGEKFSGAILVSIKDEKVISRGYGMANYELDVLNTSKTKFRIGSVTKQFTAVAIMQLFEKGKLNLNDTLDKYISDYPKGDKVTIHHLLTHTSGIFNYTNIEGSVENTIRKKYSLEALINEFKYAPYDFEPGTKYSYSNSGYVLLGYIIEKISNKSYEEYLKENVFDKLSMIDTGYDDYYKVIKKRASGYELKGEEKRMINCEFIDMSIPHAAGALYSTVEDLYIWNKALIGGELISKESLKKIMDKHINVKENDYYGYGVHLISEKLGGKVRERVDHSGIIPGFLASNEVFLEEDVQIIMITNVPCEHFFKRTSKVRRIVFEEIDKRN